MRKLALLLIFILALVLPAQAVTFTDDLGREVTVESPARTAVLIGSFADVWALAGGLDSIVATANDGFTDFDLPLGEEVLNLGGTKEVSLEGVLSCEPDFVIGSVNTQADLDLMDALDQMGIPTAYFRVSTFEEYLSMLKICTEITGCPENYTQYGADVEAAVEAARARNDGSAPSVLYIRVSSSSCKVKNSDNSVLGEMLSSLGARNIADDEESLLETLSMEVIMAEDPEHIFIVLQGKDEEALQNVLSEAFTNDPAYASLTAVQNGNVHIGDTTLYNLKPNDRWGIAYEQLADILYPQK